jgi:hypothetical protein
MRVAILMVSVVALGCTDPDQVRLNRFTNSARIAGPATAELRSVSHLNYSKTAEEMVDRAQERYGKALDDAVLNNDEADAWEGADNRKALYHRHKAAAADREAERALADMARFRQAAEKARVKQAESEAAWRRSFRAHVSERDEEWLYQILMNSPNYDKRMQAFYILEAYGADVSYPSEPTKK